MEKRTSALTAAIGLLAVVAVLWLIVMARSITMPLLIAFLIAYLLNPLVDRLGRFGINRTVAIMLLVTAFLAIASVAVVALAPTITAEFSRLPGALESAFFAGAGKLEGWTGVELPSEPAQLEDQLDSVSMSSLDGIAAFLYGQATGALATLAGLALIPVFAFFLLRDFRRIIAWCEDLVPPAHREEVAAWVGDVDHAVGRFIRGQLVVAAILGALYSLGLWLVGLPLAIVVGILSGLGNMVPYLGTAIGLVLATVLALVHGGGWTLLLLTYGVFAVVQALEGTIITPKIVGEAVGVKPLGVLVAILVFGELLGLIGLLLAPPLAVVVQKTVHWAVDRYKHSELYSSG